MCDAPNYAIGVVQGQRIDKNPHVIYYASHTLNDTQMNYTVTEKEFLVVVFGLKSLDLTSLVLMSLFLLIMMHLSTFFQRGMLNPSL